MKVICINDNWDLSGLLDPPKNLPKMDTIYTLINSPKDKWYYLSEFGNRFSWLSSHFVPLDDYLDQFTATLVEELENCQLVEA